MLTDLENTQKETALQLETLIEGRTFPFSVLFSGPAYSGRMFAANRVAGALGSSLETTIIISDRDFRTRIKASSELLRQNRTAACAAFLACCVSTFLKQFHGALLDSQSQVNRKKFSDAGDCMDLLTELSGLSEQELSGAEQLIDRLDSSLEKLYTSRNTRSVTVGKIRDIRRWCSEYSADGKTKTVIIEGIEDAGDSVSNSLLKILEEPPADTFFIIISDNPGRIGQTVLSRLRHFTFHDMDRKALEYILAPLGVSPAVFPDMQSFFLSYSGADDALLRKSASDLLAGKEPDMPALVRELEKNHLYGRFFALVVDQIRKNHLSGLLSESRCSYLLNELETAMDRGAAFNQQERLTLDFVVFRTLEVVG